MTVEEGHPEQSEALLTNALAELESLKAIDDKAEGYVTLVRCFLSAGKSSEAGKAAAKAAPIMARSHDRGVHLAFAIVNARVARTLFENQDLLAQSQTALATDLVTLYKALGGGWGRQTRSYLETGFAELKGWCVMFIPQIDSCYSHG